MPYPDTLLGDDEEVVAHLHPHASALVWPVIRLLLVVGAASFGAALAPAGDLQHALRLGIAAGALLLLLVSVAGPLLRWRTTHYVITTHRFLTRRGVLTRHGREVVLARIADVSSRQTLWERVIRAGTLTVTSTGEGAVVLRRVPGIERVQQLLTHMIEEDDDRRARAGSGVAGDLDAYPGGYPGADPAEDGFPFGWDTGAHGTTALRTDVVRRGRAV